ncbi:FAD synthetase [Pseudaminobacter salicylatoxidans]|uniref:FAD synthase n=1 Tax=Pseudaminobacter salicylatoxidans TaxID=93369 RepID=A0A316BRN3_PSESE|nr:FAD synthetase [Pseudaminobacter salicylatoxidans]PWJ76348.1 FAD synthetase [Pseudaminobacter salicylatoxidans]
MFLDYSGSHTHVVRDDQLVLPASIVTIGAFDGVHRGHQALISRAISEASAANLPAVVWTFDPPPKVFFGKARQLAPISEKLARIMRLGPDYIVLSEFCESYAARSPWDFLADLSRIGPKRIHVGADFRFGAKQAGDTDLLACHFDVALVPPVLCERGVAISSSRMRDLQEKGRMSEAASLQGDTAPSALLCGALLAEDMRNEEGFDGWF